MESLVDFDSYQRTRIVFGNHSLNRLGELASNLGARRVLLVTDQGVVNAGHADHARRSLEEAKLTVQIYSSVRNNPTTLDVDRCADSARSFGPDFIVGLGGGSAMDTAKGCNFLLTNGGPIHKFRGIGKATATMLPYIAIPTTAGTGSECQSAALIADEKSHEKMACLDPKAMARVAILDPVLTLSQPPAVTACAGIDAIAHTLETAVTTKRTSISAMYSRESFRMLARAFPRVREDPCDLDARGHMLLGAAFAGVAIENSMLGAAHAAANPLTAHHDVVHGQAVGMLLPAVVRFNAEEPEPARNYVNWAVFAGIANFQDTPERALEALIDFLQSMLARAGFPRSLAQCGISRFDIPILAKEAAAQWTATFNPRSLTERDFANLYEAALKPGENRT